MVSLSTTLKYHLLFVIFLLLGIPVYLVIFLYKFFTEQLFISKTIKQRPRSSSNGASSQMLLGSHPTQKGRTNEMIHTIYHIDSIKKFCGYYFPDETSSSTTKQNDQEHLLKRVCNRIFEKLSAFHRFKSRPKVLWNT